MASGLYPGRVTAPPAEQDLGRSTLGKARTLAWANRAALATAIVPVLAAGLLIAHGLRLLTASGDAALVNSVLVLPFFGDADLGGWLNLLVTATFWLWAVAAGTLVAGARLRDRHLSPARAQRAALGALVPGLFWLAVPLFGIFVFTMFTGPLSGPLGFLALIAVAVIYARLLLMIPDAVLHGATDPGRAWRASAGRAFPVAVTVIVGVIVPPFLVPWLSGVATEFLTSVIPASEAASLIAATVAQIATFALLSAVVMVQSATLASTYLTASPSDPHPATDYSATMPKDSPVAKAGRRDAGTSARVLAGPDGQLESQVDGEAGQAVTRREILEQAARAVLPGTKDSSTGRDWDSADHRLDELARGQKAAGHRRAIVVGGLGLPGLLMAALVLINPLGRAPVYVTAVDAQRARIAAVGWPVGQNPVVVTEHGYYDCHDEACRSHDYHQGSYSLNGGATVVAQDGSVVNANLFRQDNDFAELSRCGRGGECETGRINLPPTTGYPPMPSIGLNVAADGSLLAAVLQQPDRTKQTVNLLLFRCAVKDCAEAKPAVLWSGEGGLRDQNEVSYRNVPKLDLRVLADGSLLLQVEENHSTFTCPAECQSVAWTEYQLPKRLYYGGQPQWASNGVRRWDPFIFNTAELRAVVSRGISPEGLQFWVGARPPERNQVILVHCADPDCNNSKRLPLNVTGAPVQAVYVTASADRAFVAQETGQDLLFVSVPLG
jgi:hypothetical protein